MSPPERHAQALPQPAFFSAVQSAHQLHLCQQMEELPIQTLSEHAELEGHSRNGPRDESRFFSAVQSADQLPLCLQVEERPIHTVSEHAELEGHGRTSARDEARRHRRATSKAHEHVVSFNMDGLNGKKAASVDLEAALKKPQDKPPNSWVKRWPR